MGNIWSKVMARFHSESMAPPPPPPTWTESTHPLLKKTHPSSTHTDTVSRFTVAETAPLHCRPGLPSPSLPSRLLPPEESDFYISCHYGRTINRTTPPPKHEFDYTRATDAMLLCKWFRKIEATPLWVQQRQSWQSNAFIYAFSCWSHLGNIKVSDSYS